MNESKSGGANFVKAIPMHAALGDLDNAIASIAQRLETLGERLRPVLAPLSDKAEGGPTGGFGRAEKSPVVSAIEGYTDRVHAIEGRIGDLLGALEV
jgi:hypothetical protein